MSFPPGTEMFQFPGFASCDLWIQSQDTCATPLLASPEREDSNGASGGLPHSEIPGSKPIPGSPELIAGYHVLHRLLLPRHPPNALLALDPTRRGTGHGPPTPQGQEVVHPTPAAPPQGGEPRQRHRLVVLDLEQTHPRAPPGCPWPPPHARAAQMASDALSSRCPSSNGSDGTAPHGHGPMRSGCGGAWGDRTPDLLLAKRALSRLS